MTTSLFFTSDQVDHTVLAGRRLAVIGYGSQGTAQALSLRDSGHAVLVGVRPDGASAERARHDGFTPLPIAEAVAQADVVALLVPDQVQPALFRDAVAPALAPGATLLVAHGFNLHYGQIVPPAGHDVVLVAPKSPGPLVRSEYLAGRGVPALVGVHTDVSGHAVATALAWADALGCTRAGVLRATIADETETDLFGEQAVLCGGVTELVTAGFDTLVDAGYPPELAYFECLHELKLIVDLIWARGLGGMRRQISDTAEFGDYRAGTRIVGDASREAMRQVLAEIRSGVFARDWIAEAAAGAPALVLGRSRTAAHPVETVGRVLRQRMAWVPGAEA